MDHLEDSSLMDGEGFVISLHTYEVFCRVCRRWKIPPEARELRIWIMRQLVKKAKYIPHAAEWLKGKNVIDLRKEHNNDAEA